MNEKTRKMSPADALAVICMSAVQADTRIKPVELKKLASMITLSPLYRHITDPVEYISSVNKEYAGESVEMIIDAAIEALPSRLRETAYAWACEVVMADLGVSQGEHVYLGLLVKKMGLHGELAGKIAAVVAILNRKE